MSDSISQLEQDGVRVVRVSYADLHGVARGKDIPIGAFPRIVEEGIAHCTAIMTTDLRHNVVAGPETGFRDLVAKPDVTTLVRLPWNPLVAWALADLENVDGSPYGVDARGALRRATAELGALGYAPVVGPELEFYLLEHDEAAPGRYRRHVDQDSHVYTVGDVADPRGVLLELLCTMVDLDLGAFAANHEYGRGQFEINLRHGGALDAADRAFRFRAVVKDVAARHGLLATFMGKPWNDDEGSGFHIHLSLADSGGANVFADPAGERGLSDLLRRFTAGVLAHAPALMAYLNPTVNAYKRITPDSLAPTNVNWGYDNRLAMVRVPDDRGAATRAEVRVGDGSANHYLAIAALLFAGLDGLRHELPLPEPVVGNPYELPPERLGPALPGSLEEALDALEADDVLRAAMGETLSSTFLTIKRHEVARWRAFVSDWEFAEYAHHL
jgi:glutamine synthetase